MEDNFLKEQQYLKAKKRVKAIKGFYSHLIAYVVINIFISGIIIFGLTTDGRETFSEAIQNFGVYSTWLFWGIGLFFHWFGVFGVNAIGFGKNWEEKKISELMKKEEAKRNRKV